MRNTFILVLGIIIFCILILSTDQPSKFELHAKISQLAMDNDISYDEAKEYCWEALQNGHECYYIK